MQLPQDLSKPEMTAVLDEKIVQAGENVFPMKRGAKPERSGQRTAVISLAQIWVANLRSGAVQVEWRDVT